MGTDSLQKNRGSQGPRALFIEIDPLRQQADNHADGTSREQLEL
jgi:hypothetical protein